MVSYIMMVEWLTMYMVQNPPKYDDIICEQPLTPTESDMIFKVNWVPYISKNLNEILKASLIIKLYSIGYHVSHTLLVKLCYSHNVCDITPSTELWKDKLHITSCCPTHLIKVGEVTWSFLIPYLTSGSGLLTDYGETGYISCVFNLKYLSQSLVKLNI